MLIEFQDQPRLVNRHAVPLNSFATVRGQEHSVTEGKTAEISIDQARKLLSAMDVSNVIGQGRRNRQNYTLRIQVRCKVRNFQGKLDDHAR